MRPKVLFVHSSNETFVKLDYELLNASFEVLNLHVPLKFPHGLFKYWNGIKDSQIVFCWFASWNSFWALCIAMFFHKPSILVIGGYDVANLPQAGYGHQRVGPSRWISRLAMKIASILLPFSLYSQEEAEKNARIRADHMKIIYLGVPDPFGSLPRGLRESLVLTVGKVEWANLKRKGLEAFVQTAACFPNVKFTLVGDWVDDSIEFLRSIASCNVVFTGKVSDEELLTYYRRASVYVQASLHEGFGLSVAEAMLAGCIPVTSRAGSLPEVVGDAGIYCASLAPVDIAEGIDLAMKYPVTFRKRARERILSLFPMEERRKLLDEVIWSLLSPKIPSNDN